MSKPRAGRAGAELVAAVLNGAWRRDPPPPQLTKEDLSRASPLLAGSGAASLGWWRIQHAENLRDTAEAAGLHNAYRRLALEDAMNVRAIEHVAAFLDEIGIEPLIFKGWAVARHYAVTHLRPFGDLDIWVPPQYYRAAADMLRARSLPGALPEPSNFPVDCGWPARVMTVDLHADLERHGVTQSAAIELYQRSHCVKLGGATVRVPAMEDHLRLVAIHFLAHGAWRPLWLCDVAAMIEDLPPDFDWDLCLGRDRRVARWILCAVLLAHRLLGARIDRLPARHRSAELPAWLVATVLKEWEAPFPIRFRRPRAAHWLVRPHMIPGEIRARWPNPVAATVALHGSFDNAPRLPFQIAHFAGVARRFAATLVSGRLQRAG